MGLFFPSGGNNMGGPATLFGGFVTYWDCTGHLWMNLALLHNMNNKVSIGDIIMMPKNILIFKFYDKLVILMNMGFFCVSNS